MKIKSFDFNLKELAGSTGDFGTLFPLAIGYIVACGLDPAGFLVIMGVANIVTGIIYRLPMPIEPMKVLAVVAIAQHWSPSMVYASAFSMGIIWLIFAITGIIGLLARITPVHVIRGIQVSLGLLLAIEAFKMISSWWAIGIISIIIVLILRQNRYIPAALALFALGTVIMLVKGNLSHLSAPEFRLPPLTLFTPAEVWQTLILAGFAQVPLTITNATIATSSLIKKYWPDRNVSEQELSVNQGIMNLVAPFFGGMPMCHGAGGLAGQYYFGARTGGANIIEGLIEISMGLLLSTSIAALFTSFPLAIIGAMMFLVGIELTMFACDLKFDINIISMISTIIFSLVLNMACGFIAGLVVYYLISHFSSRKKRDDFI